MEWLTKTKAYSAQNGADVSLSIGSRKKGGSNDTVQFIFRRGCHNRITKTDYLIVGVQATKLYFKESGSKIGYKLTNHNEDNTYAAFKMKNDRLGVFKVEIGDYNLEYDSSQRLYFIDVKNKIKA